jgi:hypothetical protein
MSKRIFSFFSKYFHDENDSFSKQANYSEDCPLQKYLSTSQFWQHNMQVWKYDHTLKTILDVEKKSNEFKNIMCKIIILRSNPNFMESRHKIILMKTNHIFLLKSFKEYIQQKMDIHLRPLTKDILHKP